MTGVSDYGMIHLWALIIMSVVAVASHTPTVQAAVASALKTRVVAELASVLLTAQNCLIWDVAPFPTYAEERAMNQLQREALLCSCVVCRKTAPEWADLAKFLLRRLGMSEAQLRTAFAEEAQVERAKYLAKQRAELWPELLQYLPEKAST